MLSTAAFIVENSHAAGVLLTTKVLGFLMSSEDANGLHPVSEDVVLT